MDINQSTFGVNMELEECGCSLCCYLPVARCLSKGINCDIEILKSVLLSENPVLSDHFSRAHVDELSRTEKELIRLVVWRKYSTLSLALYYGCGVKIINLIILCPRMKVGRTRTTGYCLKTPLMVAIHSGNCSAETMRLLLENPRIDTDSHYASRTILMFAFTEPSPLPFDTLLVLLSDKRLSPARTNLNGLTLFAQVLQCHAKNLAFVLFVLQQPQLFSSICDNRKYTPLMIAVESGCSFCVFDTLIKDPRIQCRFTCNDITFWVISTEGVNPDVACAILSDLKKFVKLGHNYSPLFSLMLCALENYSHVSVITLILDSSPKDHVFYRTLEHALFYNRSTTIIATLLADDRVECGGCCRTVSCSLLSLSIRTGRDDVVMMFLRSERIENYLYDQYGGDLTKIKPRTRVLLARCRTLDNVYHKHEIIDYWRMHRAQRMCSLLLRMSRVMTHLNFVPGGIGAIRTAENWKRVQSRLNDNL